MKPGGSGLRGCTIRIPITGVFVSLVTMLSMEVTISMMAGFTVGTIPTPCHKNALFVQSNATGAAEIQLKPMCYSIRSKDWFKLKDYTF
jgi:hypothetical protein